MSYEEINIDEVGISREELSKLTGGYSVPQIVLNGKPVGGLEKLIQINQSGKLKERLGNR